VERLERSRFALFAVRLETDETRGELDGARTAQVRHSWGEERLSCGKDWVRRVPEVTEAVGVEAKIFCSDDVEDIHEEIEVMAFAFEGEVLDEAQVERGGGGLT
jgi:hypothetical protein